jgi:hypothetical protein
MLEPSSAIECLDFFHPACAELGFEIPASPGCPSGLRAVGTKIDRRPSFTVGRMKRRNVIALHFELGRRWQNSHAALLFGYPAALILGGPHFLSLRFWTGQQTCERNGDESK